SQARLFLFSRRRRHTSSYGDWSSDVCSSDLIADIEVDIRTVPGDTEDEVRRHLDKALGPLIEDVEIEKLFSKNASSSPTGTPLRSEERRVGKGCRCAWSRRWSADCGAQMHGV